MRNPRRTAEDSARDHCDEWNLSAAGDKCCRHDGHAAVTLVLDGTGSHDTRDTAACTDQDRDKGLTGKTELSEYTVEHERNTRHVTASLEERQEDEQYQHLGNEAEYRANAGYDTVKGQTLEPVNAVNSVKSVLHQNRNAGHPRTVISGIRLVEAVLGEVSYSVAVCCAECFFLISVCGDLGSVNGDLAYCEGLLVLYLVGNGLAQRESTR